MVLIHLNNQILEIINNYQAPDKVTISINNIEIQLTKSFAVAISKLFYSQYLLDNNINRIDIHTDIKSIYTFDVLKDILQYNKSEIECDGTILYDLFHIGMALESEELINFYKLNLIDKENLDKNNCIQLLEFYFDISAKDKISECVDFISSHFYEIDTDQLKSISQKIGLEILQRIFNNDKLVVEDEDSLAHFIISLAKESETYCPLIENIHFELCNESVIKEIKNFTDENNFQSIVNSLADSLIRSRNLKPRILGKYETDYFKSGNVEMSASSTYNGTVDVINKYQVNTCFYTANDVNSWVQWKLKQNYAIRPTEYIVRTCQNYSHFTLMLKTWRIEGTTIDGETKVIHEVTNSSLRPDEIRKYSIKTNDKFVSFRLIQTDTNQSTKYNDYHKLLLDVFDFSENVYELKFN